MKIKEELNMLTKSANGLNKEFVLFARNTIINLQDNYSLSAQDIMDIVGLTKCEYDTLMKDGCLKEISSGLISVLFLLTNGNFSLSNAPFLNEEKLYNFSDLLQNYRKQKRIEKLEMLADAFGLKTDEEIDDLIEGVKTLKEEIYGKESKFRV